MNLKLLDFFIVFNVKVDANAVIIIRKKGKDTGSVRCLFDERSKQFLAIKYNARPNGSIDYREYKVIKRYKY